MIISDAQPVQFWLYRLDTFNELEVDGIFSRCFCQPFEAEDEITIQFKDTTGYVRKLVVYNSSGTLYTTSFTETASGLYQLSFTPASIGITDDEIQFNITDGVLTTLAKSDCISIKEVQDETVLINYHNNRIFASLSSAVGTPDPEFNLRIPAVFFKQRFPKTTEVMKLSNSRSLQLNAEIGKQKLLQVKHMPYHMHLKTQLALAFQNVTINNLEYTAEESYEIEEGNIRSSRKQASIWLTEKEYILRNIL